ncbi:bifunctional methylenetetrahydrofolate dehydrogenase/methenyltetrahydrofolate cyclohydrolase FolD [Novosphingobium sp. SG720]|uniref:bifunctional methylenetetrahydrofolate dehydrogenase/methenyltetrahydrofolate cyclohydrolase FolD n=1 Tax=Novosphingobium sp. SG720 TaxID=2586998 RepID=UPI001446B244|nr:bifunctional methylenetetrahydrofolate dehydrogenase/methenyltetrahydrofolate cyclohydrolase FolD [Novosphingobium sp. SG720]NKJ44519.1 methylenetetrahydrofolate dehydrogenase (NADP+)/methenyltetrahydrofolate cyclohydrolase [Novosphingobium sp. SG720]
MARVIDGRALARKLDERTAQVVAKLLDDRGIKPGLAVVLVGDDPASEIYVAHKVKACLRVGIESFKHRLPASVSQQDLLALVARLNHDPKVHGILVQVPLPRHIDPSAILGAIDPAKDVDGFHPVNVGRLSTGTGGLVPCTPLGVMMLLDSVVDEIKGMSAVVIGKSNIVGKPIAMLLLEREATVTVTHIATRGLPDIARQADIIIAAAGVPRLVRGFWVKAGAVVIDVGITRVSGASGERDILVGDIAIDEMNHAGAVTPVPGGVGPMTIACLLANTVKAAKESG